MRLQLTNASDLAVRALLVLGAMARAEGDVVPERLGGESIAAAIGTSPGLLPQVMRPLVRAGWVDGRPGPGGGYHLLVTLEDIDVLAVIEAVEGPTDSRRCVLIDRPCQPEGPCALHEPWTRARTLLIHELAATSLASLTEAATGGVVPQPQEEHHR